MKKGILLFSAIAFAMSAQSANYAPKSFGTIGHTAIRPSSSKITASRNKAKKQRRKSK